MYYLESEISGNRITDFKVFNRVAILKAIVYYLQNNPTDTVHYYKECNSVDNDYVGDDLIDFYAINPKNGKPSKLILKGDKIFYKSLEN